MPTHTRTATRRRQSSVNPDDFVLLTGRSNPKLALDIAKILGKDLREPISMFADGEIRVRIPQNIRRRHVFIIQSTSRPVNDSIMELIFMIDAVKRSSASEISVIVPYFGYARQDRKEMPRVPISSSVVANMIANAGADRILTLDIHAEQEEGFIPIPWDNIYGSAVIIPAIKNKKSIQDIVVASPDKNGMTRATGYAKLLGAHGVALVYKQHDIHINNKTESLGMIGDVKGKDVLIVDDMLDTGGTIINAALFLEEAGAKSIRVAITHGLFSTSALEKITNSGILEIITTDTILQSDQVRINPKIKIVSVADLLAQAIQRIQTGESISSLILH